MDTDQKISLTTDQVHTLLQPTFRSIHPNWYPIFHSNLCHLHVALKYILETTSSDKLAPPIKDIFNAFMINPYDIKVIIIGQDPYPKVNDAHGLAFSTLNSTPPASLKNIFNCIHKSGYECQSNNLIEWVLNGVFLLNSSLTTEIGHTKKHSTYWFPFVSNLISTLTNTIKNRSMSIFLWGSDAQKIIPFIKRKHNIFKWTHPSPLADCQLEESLKFKYCDHFTKVDINWNTGQAICLYTDGGGMRRCAFGVHWPDIANIVCLVKNCEYELTGTRITSKPNTDKPPTSQRAEYLALAYAMLIVHKLHLTNVTIVTDSRNGKGIITEWTKKKEEKYENADLVKIMRSLYALVKEKVTIEHVLSHQKGLSVHNDGNETVDRLVSRYLSTQPATDCSITIDYFNVHLRLPID